MTLKSILISAALCLLAGCAHPIKITPDLTKVERASSSPPRLEINVGYYIPPQLISNEITTPGGGGDNVRYFPYSEIEIGYQKMLSNVFKGVVKLTSIADPLTNSHNSIDYTIMPILVTNSGGSGFFTWPPTNFSVDLTSEIRDTSGKLIASPRVVGTGTASTSERISDFGIAGKRSMEDALLKMQGSLFETPFPGLTLDARKVQQQTPSGEKKSTERLVHIKELKDKGLISEVEYETTRKKILEEL